MLNKDNPIQIRDPNSSIRKRVLFLSINSTATRTEFLLTPSPPLRKIYVKDNAPVCKRDSYRTLAILAEWFEYGRERLCRTDDDDGPKKRRHAMNLIAMEGSISMIKTVLSLVYISNLLILSIIHICILPPTMRKA